MARDIPDIRQDSLSKTIFYSTLEREQRRSRPTECWMDNMKEWTSLSISKLLTMASRRKDWKRISADSSFTSLKRPSRSRDRTELKCPIILKRIYAGRIRLESCSQPLFKNWKFNESVISWSKKGLQISDSSREVQKIPRSPNKNQKCPEQQRGG